MGGYTHGKRKLTANVWPRPIRREAIGHFSQHESSYISDVVKFARDRGIELIKIKAELILLFNSERVPEIPQHLTKCAVLFFYELAKAIEYPYAEDF